MEIIRCANMNQKDFFFKVKKNSSEFDSFEEELS